MRTEIINHKIKVKYFQHKIKLAYIWKSSDPSDEEWILGEQDELFSETTEVSQRLVDEVVVRRNVSLTPILLLHFWEVCALYFKISFENLQLPVRGVDSCHQIRNGIVSALQL